MDLYILIHENNKEDHLAFKPPNKGEKHEYFFSSNVHHYLWYNGSSHWGSHSDQVFHLLVNRRTEN